MAIVEADGLEVLNAQFSVAQIANIISKTARWVDKRTFELLPSWYPETWRGALMYNSEWTVPRVNKNRQTNISVHKSEGNTRANTTLTYALGSTKSTREGWSCCHIWDHGDTKFQTSNFVVGDSRFYSCVANMVLLPTPLKAFTDSMPEIKEMLRIAAFHHFGWYCDHEKLDKWNYLQSGKLPDHYPLDWPNHDKPSLSISGIVSLNGKIKKRIDRRIARINDDLINAGEYYPREIVNQTLAYWENRNG